MRAIASRTRFCGSRKKGSVMTPCSERLTLSTSLACSSMLMFLWMMPSPPSRAMAMARRLSVTVSIAAEMMGRLSESPSHSVVRRSTSFGKTSDACGMSRTSSNASPSLITLLICCFLQKIDGFQIDQKSFRILRRIGNEILLAQLIEFFLALQIVAEHGAKSCVPRL